MQSSHEDRYSSSNGKNPKYKSNTMMFSQQNICLPSNLLQKKKNILQQHRMLKTSRNSRVITERQPITLMSKTFCHSQDISKKMQDKLQMLIEQKIDKTKNPSKSKDIKSPLYRRISNIQADNKELAGVSFSKLLSRMQIIEGKQQQERKKFSDYRKKKHKTFDTKGRIIPDFQCLESKLFTLQCPENWYESIKVSPKKSFDQSTAQKTVPVSNRLFRRYFNPHGQKSDMMAEYENLQFDERYIYRNGKKSECKRIHNFYTSQTFKKNYQKHMRNTIDTFSYADGKSRQ